MAEFVREIEVTIEIDTNKRTTRYTLRPNSLDEIPAWVEEVRRKEAEHGE